MDALLRCPVCYEFLNIAMMTKCSHNFCSLCIRTFLNYKLQCPVCDSETIEKDLRNNHLLDDLVITFQEARAQTSNTNFESPPMSPVMPASKAKCRTPREMGPKSDGSSISHFFQKGSKKSPTQETQRVGLCNTSIPQGEMQKARTQGTNNVDLHSPIAPPLPKRRKKEKNVEEQPMVEEEEVVTELASVSAEEMDNSFSAQQPSDSPLPSDNNKPVNKVPCPVCSVEVSEHFINKHLDICLNRGEKKESLRSGKKCPMGKPVYSLLSLQELKRKLKEHHLSVNGTRDQLIKRHQAFVLSYNVQCDARNPKSAKDIAKEVEANEKIRSKLKGKTKPVMHLSKNQSEEKLDEMLSNYRKKHSSEFSYLVAQVQSHLKKTRQTPTEGKVCAEEDETQAPQTTDCILESEDCTVSGRCTSMVSEVTEVDELASAGEMPISASPSNSDISISSSVSNVFSPEPARAIEELEDTPLQKPTPSSREEDVSPPVTRGKRRRLNQRSTEEVEQRRLF